MSEIPVEAEGPIVNSKRGLFDVFGASWMTSIASAEVGATKTVLSTTGNSCVTTGKDRVSVGGMEVRTGETGISLSNADVCSGALRAKIANRHAMNSAASGGIQ